jgi:hypothetical protein
LVAAFAAAGIVGLGLSSALGSGQARLTQGQEASIAQSSGQVIDWSGSPLLNGVSEPSVVAAAGGVTFPVTVPTNAGSPQAIYAEPGTQSVAFVYNDPAMGRFWVVEKRSVTTQAELQSDASCDHSQGCQGSWTMTSLNGGVEGLLLQGPAGSTDSVMVLHNSVLFNILGPADTFSASDAIAVANSMLTASPVGAQ